MRKSEDFELKILTLNKNRVKTIVPKKTITLEKGIRKSYEILKKYV